MVAETEEEGLGTGKKRIGVFIFGCRMELVGTGWPKFLLLHRRGIENV